MMGQISRLRRHEPQLHCVRAVQRSPLLIHTSLQDILACLDALGPSFLSTNRSNRHRRHLGELEQGEVGRRRFLGSKRTHSEKGGTYLILQLEAEGFDHFDKGFCRGEA